MAIIILLDYRKYYQLFNKFYGAEKIISDNKLVLNTNISLIKAIMFVLIKGLKLLGLAVLEEM